MLSSVDILQHHAGKTESLFTQVAERLAIAVVSGAISAGELIPNEANLWQGGAVSRSVYREALKFLSAKGLIEAKPRSGTRAASVSNWNLLDPDVLRWSMAASGNEKFIRDLYELRSFLEPNAARLAAQRRTVEQAQALRSAYNGMVATAPYSPENARYDIQFHEMLIDSCGNDAILCLKGVVITTLVWSLRLLVGKTTPDYSEALADHRRVLEAVEQQDGARAQAIMTVLVMDSLADTIAMFRAQKSRRDALK